MTIFLFTLFLPCTFFAFLTFFHEQIFHLNLDVYLALMILQEKFGVQDILLCFFFNCYLIKMLHLGVIFSSISINLANFAFFYLLIAAKIQDKNILYHFCWHNFFLFITIFYCLFYFILGIASWNQGLILNNIQKRLKSIFHKKEVA